MPAPDESRYELTNLLSQNELCQSWLAVDRLVGAECFLKIVNPESSVDKVVASGILQNSFNLQRRIKSSRIITARRKYPGRDKLYIEYEHLDPQEWQELTEDVFWRYPQSILTQMFLLVDLVHLYELVHCDLKLSNFLVRQADGEPRLVLIDLDFLTETGSSPKARILGSPRHIAPEILANDTIVPQSDNYSLGVALMGCLEYVHDSKVNGDSGVGSIVAQLSGLAHQLTLDDPLLRPYNLLDALVKAELISESAHRKATLELFSSQLVGGLRRTRNVKSGEEKSLKKIIFEDHRILGVHEELIGGLTEVWALDRTTAIALFKAMVEGAGLKRYGDYWRFEFRDDDLRSSLDAIDKALGRPDIGGRYGSLSGGALAGEVLRRSLQLRKNGEYLRAFIDLKTIWEKLGADQSVPSDVCAQVVRELALLARGLGRLEDAADYFGRLAAINESRSQLDLEARYDHICVLLDLGNVGLSRKVIEKGLEEARSANDVYYELMFTRIEAGRIGSQGDYQKAENLLESVRERAATENLHELEVKACYTGGIVDWRRGEFGKAREQLETSYEIARKHNLLHKSVSTILGLSLLNFEMALYNAAIKYGKLTIRQIEEPSDRSIVANISITLSHTYSRLGEHNKAEYWLLKYIAPELCVPSHERMVIFYISDAFIKINRADYRSAGQSLAKAQDLMDSDTSLRTVTKLYHNLAEMALFQGQHRRCLQYQTAGLEHLKSYGDETSRLELELIGILNDMYNDNRSEAVQELPAVVESLIGCNSYYFAGLGLFHLLLRGIDEGVTVSVDRFDSLIELSRKSRAPFFKALTALIDCGSAGGQDNGLTMRFLKTAYRILESSGNRFGAGVVCRTLARRYGASSSHKLARKFYDQSLKLARAMQNESMAANLLGELEEVNLPDRDQSALLESIYAISEVFKNIKDYGKSLTRAVEFAVDQTGAERGVLLLKSEPKAGLHMAAMINCDEDSLDDIVDFSSSIPLDVVRKTSPLIIDNALTDKRTRNYRSIVAHNILSVICIPITLEGRVLGVLYLDHHTIPALFDKNDVIYVSSIANLLAVMIATIRSYRDITLINRQLVEDVNRSGRRQSFITNDVSLRELFDKLPEIARTNAPVLVVGESGTGKEILCEMIHNLSLRRDKPLIKLNCAAVAGSLIESELFGVAANVATDVKEREGKFAAADGGTLLLDEIGDMPMEVQSKVLRAIEYQQFERVGSNKTMYTDIRFVYATNKDLLAMVQKGNFRPDLYYRINTVTIEIPPLRERPDDILLLTDYFLNLFSQPGNSPRFASEALEALGAHYWPGNVRELKNLVERCCIIYPGEAIGLHQLPQEISSSRPSTGLKDNVAERLEKDKIRKALAAHGWNQSRASAELDIPLSTLRRKIKKYNISRLV